eukprot:Nk52_evm9s157 gene=Nk52_evmTU9s157
MVRVGEEVFVRVREVSSVGGCLVNVPLGWVEELMAGEGRVCVRVEWGDAGVLYVGWSGGVCGAGEVEIDRVFAQGNGLEEGLVVCARLERVEGFVERIFVEAASEGDAEVLGIHRQTVEEQLLNQVRVVNEGMVLGVRASAQVYALLRVLRVECEGEEGEEGRGVGRLGESSLVLLQMNAERKGVGVEEEKKDEEVMFRVQVEGMESTEEATAAEESDVFFVDHPSCVLVHPDEEKQSGCLRKGALVHLNSCVDLYAPTDSQQDESKGEKEGREEGGLMVACVGRIGHWEGVAPGHVVLSPWLLETLNGQLPAGEPEVGLGTRVKIESVKQPPSTFVKITARPCVYGKWTLPVFGKGRESVMDFKKIWASAAAKGTLPDVEAELKRALIAYVQDYRCLSPGEHKRHPGLSWTGREGICVSNNSLLPIRLKRITGEKCIGMIHLQFHNHNLYASRLSETGTKEWGKSANADIATLLYYFKLSMDYLEEAEIEIGPVINVVDNTVEHSMWHFPIPLPKISLSHLPGGEPGQIRTLLLEQVQFAKKCFDQQKEQNWFALPFSRNIFLTGPPGCGIGLLLRSIIRKFAFSYQMCPYMLNCNDLLRVPVNKGIASLQCLFENSVLTGPSLICFTHYESLLAGPLGSEEEADSDGRLDSKSNAYISFIREYLDSGRILFPAQKGSHQNILQPPFVIFASQDGGKLNGTLSKHLLGFLKPCCVHEIELPTCEGRRDILHAILTGMDSQEGAIRKDGYSENIDLISRLEDIAALADGFNGKDLAILAERALYDACVRMTRFADDKSPLFFLNHDDFVSALDKSTPAILQSGVRITAVKDCDVDWDRDVVGMSEPKRIVKETLVYPVTYKELYSQCPLRMPCGVLLYGPPGCGKSLLARAIPKKCRLKHMFIKGPELLNKFIGASEEAVRNVFITAKSLSPCIICFDEFDAIAPARGHDNTGVTDRIVNQLLTELDGVQGMKGVYIVATTSRPDLIDRALLRPGRLDKLIYCGFPEEEPTNVFDSAAKSALAAFRENISIDVDLCNIVCERYSYADIRALMYNAYLHAFQKGTVDSVKLTMDDLKYAKKNTRASLSTADKAFYNSL